jgi:membrane fusion protein, multidrug efflux system
VCPGRKHGKVARIHWVVAVIGLTAAGSAAWWWQHRGASAGLAVAAVSASGPGAGGGGPGSAARGPGGAGPAVVEVGRVEAVRLDDDASAVGSLRASRGVMLRPEVSGRIRALGFVNGQPVRAGQMLVQLDDALQVAQLRQAEAQAQIARTNLDRSRELLAQNFISPSAVDQNAAALQVAQAQVALAAAQVQRMRIAAPFDGMTGIGVVNVGDYVKDGADLVSVDDVRVLHVDFRLPERLATRLKPDLAVEVSLDALPGQTLQARLLTVDSQVDAAARSVLVRARLDNPRGQLKPGMFARTRVVLDSKAQALMVPEEALVPLAGKQYVFRLVPGPGGEGPLAERIEARIGARAEGKVEILSGLAAGDQVITAGQARLQRGDRLPVRVVDLARAGAPPQRAGSAPARGPASAPAGA